MQRRHPRGVRTTHRRRSLYLAAWAAAVDDYDAAFAAHYIAHLEDDAGEALRWNRISLEHARADGRAGELMGSLLVSTGASYEALGETSQAERYFALAAERGVIHHR